MNPHSPPNSIGKAGARRSRSTPVKLTIGALAGLIAGSMVSIAAGQPPERQTAAHVSQTYSRFESEMPIRTLPKFMRLASDIVEARVVGTTQSREPNGHVYTTVQLDILSRLLGDLDSFVTVQYPGGTDDNHTTTTSHNPALKSGEEVLLFLSEAHPGHVGLLGLAQGVIRSETLKSGERMARGHFAGEAETWTQFRMRLDTELALRTEGGK